MASNVDLIINSAGNQILVSGLNEPVDIESYCCAAQSFIYTGMTEEWAKQDNCIFLTNIPAYHDIDMWSNGLVVGVPQFAFETPSFVKFYSLDIQSAEWIQLGNEIKEISSGQFIGNFIAMPFDGSIAALGSSSGFPIRVYKLNENYEWLQFSYDISIPAAKYSILPIISASDLVLALPGISPSDQIMTHIFVFNDVF